MLRVVKPPCVSFSSFLDAVAPGLDCSGRLPLAVGTSRLARLSLRAGSHAHHRFSRRLEPMSNLRLCIALRGKVPSLDAAEDARDRTTRGQGLDVVSTQMLPITEHWTLRDSPGDKLSRKRDDSLSSASGVWVGGAPGRRETLLKPVGLACRIAIFPLI